MTRLTALMDGRIIGHIFEEQGRLSLLYSDDWRNARGAYPLSTSMPLAARRHADSVVRAFLWGLLPDNDQVLRRWGRKFQVSARNPFALISHVGEDCAWQALSQRRHSIPTANVGACPMDASRQRIFSNPPRETLTDLLKMNTSA